MERVAHLEPFPLLLRDKMALEPRLSLLSLLGKEIQAQAHLNTLFTPTEWTYYQQLIQQEPVMVTTSMGRLIDAVAVLLGCCAVNSYEGQAAMELEALAMSVSDTAEPYHIPVMHNRILILPMLQQILLDLQNGHEPAWIALRFWHSLAELAADLGNLLGIADIGLSGGVFQNALLVGLIQERMSPGKKLWLHASLSPNDENISFGQLVLAHLKTRPGSFVHHPETNEEKSHHANYIMGEVSSSAIRNPASANSRTCV
jgi:hydrogenase maturation protein HypF